MNSLLLDIDWSFLQHTIASNTVADYIWFILLLVIAFLLIKPLVGSIYRLCARLFRRWFPDASERPVLQEMTIIPLQRLMQCIILYAAVHRLEQPFNVTLIGRKAFNVRLIDAIDHVFIFCVILFTTLLIARAVDFIFHLRYKKADEESDTDRLRILPLLRDVIKLMVWTAAVFTVLGTVFHVNIPALITGLGIGGIAIALAGKETVENLFASFTILADKPFHSGDSIKLGAIEGVVTKVGFRSTRLISPDGSLVIIPNKKLIDENLENLTVRKTRRIRIPMLIRYGISEESLAIIIKQIRETIQQNPNISSPTEVTVEAFDAQALQLMITYHLHHPLRSGNLTDARDEIAAQIFSIINKHATHSSVTNIRIIDADT